MDTCPHYLGTVWNGSLTWSEPAELFESLYSDISSRIEEHEEYFDTVILKRLSSISKLEGINLAAALNRAFWEDCGSSALLLLLPLFHGERQETDGMLSGSGYSIYAADKSLLDQLNVLLHNISEQ